MLGECDVKVALEQPRAFEPAGDTSCIVDTVVADGQHGARTGFSRVFRVGDRAGEAATSLAAAGTALLTTSLFALGSQVRTFQNAINGPLYLLGGVLVPTSYLPAWLQPLSPYVFFYWSADLLRAALAPADVHATLTGLFSIVALGAVAALLGYVVLQRMLERMRRGGTLGLV